MRRFSPLVLVIACVTFTASTAQAGWKEFWAGVHLDTKRNSAWPEPFRTIDRRVTRSTFAAMANKGWKLETTITDYHFDQETQRLTEAGRQKIRWILREAPPQRRTVFVMRSERNDQATAIRVDSVQRAITQLLPRGALPPVVQTDIAPRGASASEVHGIHTRAEATRPDPVLSAGGESDSGS